MVYSNDIIKNVISNIEDSRCRNLFELESEFNDGSRKISELIESWKRRIVDAGSLHGCMNKMENRHEKENIQPNVAMAAEIPSEKMEKDHHYQSSNDQSSNQYLDVPSMKVSELREHLRIRNLDDKGLKKDLQERLQKDIEAKNMFKCEMITTDTLMIPVTTSEVECSAVCRYEEVEDNPEKLSQAIDDVDHSGKTMEMAVTMVDDERCDESRNEDISMESNLETSNSSAEAKQKSSLLSMDAQMEKITHVSSQATEMEPSVCESFPTKSPKKQNLGKKIMSMFSPNKLKSLTTKENIDAVNGLKDERATSGTYSSEETSRHPSNGIVQPVQNYAAPVVPLTNETASQSCVQQDTPESAFFAKEPLVPNTFTHDTKDQDYSLTTPAVPIKVSGKIFSSSTAQAKKKEIDEARKARLEKIRNKVKKNHESAKDTEPQSSVKQSTCSNGSHDSAEERKKAIAAKMREKYTQSKQVVGIAASCQKSVTQPNMHAEAKQTGVMSPMDTYEMSDRDESDSGAESDEHENSPQKKIPKWAQKQNLIPALERQFLDGPNKMDPDTIFPEVSTCDLEAIFGRKKERYLKRKSTGDWRKDRVTASEKLVYKRKMGFK